MSLTSGRGPLSSRRAGVFSAHVPDDLVYVEPFQRRVRALLRGEAVVESERVVLVHRPGTAPEYAFPSEDVMGVPGEPVPEAPGFVRVPWDAAEQWFEEDERVLLHPRNPYHRIDCLKTHRRLRVAVQDTILVDTTDTLVLYETSLPPRLYVHPRHVLAYALVPSESVTFCPYKGTATYWSYAVGDEHVPDVAFSYQEPLPESTAIRGLLGFEETRVTVETDLPAPVDLHAHDRRLAAEHEY